MADAILGAYWAGSIITGTTMNQSLVHGYLVGSVAVPAIIAAGELAVPVLKLSGRVVGKMLSGAGNIVSDVLSKCTCSERAGNAFCETKGTSSDSIHSTMLAEVIPEKDQADIVEDDWILVNS